MSAKPKALDCFAGCGGMTEGFKRAGFEVVGAIEIDEDACKAYRKNHRNVHLWARDVEKISCPEILRTLGLRKGELDLLGGCPPCQGFSTLRTYNGGKRVIDARNDLIYQFKRLVVGLKPKHVMMENVPGLHKDRRLAEFIRVLERNEYTVDVKVLDAVEFGVPQRRRRLVLLASRQKPVEFAAPSKQRLTVKKAIGNLPRAGRSGDELHDLPENRSTQTRERIAAIPKNGGSRTALPKHLCLRCHRKSNGFFDVYGRMSWNDPAPTITTGCFNPSKGRFLHPTANRAITMREAALLQSFPRSYRFPAELGKVKIATMIGNALPPEFIKRHARKFLSKR
jgi:DNA (cytosine-5)-methyltransferase 1